MLNNKASRFKITCIIHSLSLGGMEKVMSGLLNFFAKREGVEVSLLLIGRYRSVDFAISDRIQIHIPDFEFDPERRNLSSLKTMRFIRKAIKEIDPNTILSFGEYWNNLVLLSLSGLKYPVYISDRSEPNKDLGKVQNLLRDKLYPKAAGYIAQTAQAKEIAYNKNWNINIVVIGNPINKVSDIITVEKKNIVLTVGRLIPTKHIDELIQIFRKIDSSDWQLVIVGGNSKNLNLLEEYKQLVCELKMEDRIHLVGSKTNVADYYKNAKIFAFTSSSEGFPNVIGEAMAYGLPVIAYDCLAGPSDLIMDQETGFLVEERNQQQYIENLKKLMENSELRHKQGLRALKKIQDFDADAIAEKFFAFITK